MARLLVELMKGEFYLFFLLLWLWHVVVVVVVVVAVVVVVVDSSMVHGNYKASYSWGAPPCTTLRVVKSCRSFELIILINFVDHEAFVVVVDSCSSVL